ncbi:hypothetical protein V6N13_073007 [Hibiscus sabdariffa]
MTNISLAIMVSGESCRKLIDFTNEDTRSCLDKLLTPREGLRVKIPRVNKAQLVEYKDELKRVREVTEVALSCLSHMERRIVEKPVGRKGRMRPRKNISSSLWVVNESLSYSNCFNCKRVILREAQETLNLSKLIGAEIVGNEDDIVKDIARIIEPRRASDVSVMWGTGQFQQTGWYLAIENGISRTFVLQVYTRRVGWRSRTCFGANWRMWVVVDICQYMWWAISIGVASSERPCYFIAVREWLDRWKNLVVRTLPRGFSDHSPLLLIGDNVDRARHKLQRMKGFLKVWNKVSFDNIDERILVATTLLKELDVRVGNGRLVGGLVHCVSIARLWPRCSRRSLLRNIIGHYKWVEFDYKENVVAVCLDLKLSRNKNLGSMGAVEMVVKDIVSPILTWKINFEVKKPWKIDGM